MSTRYVWSKWNRQVDYTWHSESISDVSGISISTSSVKLYQSATRNDSDGKFTLHNPAYYNYGESRPSGHDIYPMTMSSGDDIGNKYIYYGGSFRGNNQPVWFYGPGTQYEYYSHTNSKGTKSYGNVSSGSASTYPDNNYSGKQYWYVKLGSDTIDPVSLTYTDPVKAGGTVNLTITPSSGIIHGGNITYTIQTTTNGEDYYDAGTTTGTTFAVTVPEDAAIWNVRVYAKDDTGFTSATYVYGNNIDTWVTVIQSEIVPASGDLGYLTSKNLVAIGVSHLTEQTYSISATLNGEPCFEKSGVAITDATYITLDDETWESIPQETEQTLDVIITFPSSTDSRTYTFKKFTYDDTSLEGVMEGTARAIRIKREYQTQILGKNMPKEIIKVDNPVNTSGLKEATASESQVFAGYTFFAGDSELRTGEALAQPTTVTADVLPPGVTAYNQAGEFLTGTGSGLFKYMYKQISFSGSAYITPIGNSVSIPAGFTVKSVSFIGPNTVNNGEVTGTPLLPNVSSTSIHVYKSGYGYCDISIVKSNDNTIIATCSTWTLSGSQQIILDLYLFGI